jgi:hypothetical protein
MDQCREERRLAGRTAVVFLDNAPTRGSWAAMHAFRRHNVPVILLPPHLTHVPQPVDCCWAKQFKVETTEA